MATMVFIIQAALKGKEAFTQTEKGMKGIAKSSSLLSNALKALSVAAAGLFVADSIKKAAAFSDQMMAVQAATSATTMEFAQLNDEAKRIGREFGRFTTTDAAQAMKNLAFAGFSVQETLTAIEPVMQLSQVGFLELDVAARAVAGSMRSFGLQAKDTQMIVDQMTQTFISSMTTMFDLAEAIRFVGPIAEQAGMSFAEMNAVIGKLANANIRGGRAGVYLRNILIRLQAPTEEGARILGELGIQLFNLEGPARAAGLAMQENFRDMAQLERQTEETTEATRQLRRELGLLSLDEAKNSLEVMKIKRSASEQNRRLTREEKSRIKELVDANEGLRVKQAELQVQQQQLNLQSEETRFNLQQVKEDMENNNAVFEASQGELRSISDIAEEFNTKMQNLSQSQKVAALTSLFGRRNLAAFSIIMREMDEDTASAEQTLREYTASIEDSSGAANTASDIIEKGLGNQIMQVRSAFEAFQIELVEKITPALLELFEVAKKDLIPALVEIIPLVVSVATAIGLLATVVGPIIMTLAKVPGLLETLVISLIALKIAIWAVNVALYANPMVLIVALVFTLIAAIVLLALEIKKNFGLIKFLFDELGNYIFDNFISPLESAFTTLGNVIMAPFRMLNNLIKGAREELTTLINDIQTLDDKALGKLGSFLNVVSGGNINIESFAGGGVVSGAKGEPQFAIVHGKERIYEEEDVPGNSIVLNTNDNINVSVNGGAGMTESESQRIGKMVAEQIVEQKRLGIEQLLSEVG